MSVSSDSRPGRTCFEGVETHTNREPQGRLFLIFGLILNFLAYAQFYLNRNDLMITYT